ncbi:MAG TPA: phosphatase PAP2 family protein [Chitinophagaceae bacterium]|nr:phosphatase PAP2 family protein [Chitinophagaceae bacterium]
MFSLLQSSLWQKIEQWDQWLFIQLNSQLTNPLFDEIMPFIRKGMHWAPLYLFLGVFVLLNFKNKGWWWIVFFTCTVALTDMGGTNIFKDNFDRDRPCADFDFSMHVRLLVNCVGNGNSFISNHAANHFGMAAFFFVTFWPVLKKWALIGFLWAACIAYAQVYVGIHYPLDVLTGALFGALIGFGTGKLFNKRYQFAIFDNQPTMSS